MKNPCRVLQLPGLRPLPSKLKNSLQKIYLVYSPYSVAVHKKAGEIEARSVLAPESKITVGDGQETGRMNPKKHMKDAPGRKPASDHKAARMPATSRIPVSKVVWGELAGLKKPGETYDHLLEGMIEREKKNRLFEDMDRIEKKGRFVAMKW